MKAGLCRLLAVALTLSLAGCALSPERPEVAAASSVLAARQHAAAGLAYLRGLAGAP